jgi:fumarate hydratase class I
MISKAERGSAAIDAMVANQCVYLAATGGAAYLISKTVRSAKVLAFNDLGREAINEFEVDNMPVVVAVNSEGNSLHHASPKQWRIQLQDGGPAR